jgi:hypothetical protein
MFGQVPTQFKGPDGEWSVVAMLLAGFGVLSGIIVILFRSRESEHTTQIAEMKAVILELKVACKELQNKADECHEDRVTLHSQMAELKIQVARFVKS